MNLNKGNKDLKAHTKLACAGPMQLFFVSNLARESSDGKYLYYNKAAYFTAGLFRQPTGGGEEVKIFDFIRLLAIGDWALTDKAFISFTATTSRANPCRSRQSIFLILPPDKSRKSALWQKTRQMTPDCPFRPMGNGFITAPPTHLIRILCLSRIFVEECYLKIIYCKNSDILATAQHLLKLQIIKIAYTTTPGQFVVPPAKAEEMYHPETFGRTGTDFVKVE